MSGLLGIVVAFLGVFLEDYFNNPKYEGIASILIGVILVAFSLVLLRESRSLLMGETLSKKTLEDIISSTEKDEAIEKIVRHFSMYLGPEEVLLQLMAIFHDDLNTQEILALSKESRKPYNRKILK